jgi:hypothetical protein
MQRLALSTPRGVFVGGEIQVSASLRTLRGPFEIDRTGSQRRKAQFSLVTSGWK